MKNFMFVLLSLLVTSHAYADTVGNLTISNGTDERIESASLRNGNGGGCTINSQSGSWIASASSGGTGSCTWTFTSGIFSGSPRCTCTSNGNGADICYIGGYSTSSVSTQSRINNGVNANDDITLICMGPR